MSLKQTHRYVYKLRGFLKPTPEGAPYVTIRDILELFRARIRGGEARKLYSNGDVIFRIRDIQFFNDDAYAVLLLSNADKDFTNPQLENFENGEIRTVEVLENEGNAYSAHLLIEMTPIEEGVPVHRILLESVPGISRHYTKLFLTSEIRECFHATYNNVNGDEKSYRAIFELDGESSLTIRQALENGGVLENISFVSHRPRQDGQDEEACVEEISSQVSLKMERGITTDRATSALERTVNHYRQQNYQEAVIRIHTDKGSKTTSLDLTENEDFLEKSFFQMEKIADFAIPLQQAPSEIRPDVVSKMIFLLENEGED